MDSNNRTPTPEELLTAVKLQDSRSKKGRLKIFLGMAPGVGKTYAMLEEAHRLQENGLNIVVGIINTHGRKETANLLEGLKIIPPKIIPYKNKTFEELDLDAILKLQPQIVLVDEIAHSNIRGSRHLKRWQDVVEILDKGIDVCTTLNVQHIESIKEAVENITTITIRESVPDVLIETATSIQLVDLSPDALIQRLREGKVYLGDQSEIAAAHFFQPDRLTALREIVLRYTAEKIDHDLHGMVLAGERSGGWRPKERVLVAVSPSIQSQKLVRAARRLAFSLGVPWIAAHINTGETLSDSEKAMLDKNLALARELGAEVIATNDSDIAEGIQRIARQKSVTHIIIGRQSSKQFFDFLRPSLLDRLSKMCKDIDIHIIRQEALTTTYRGYLFEKITKNLFYSYILILCPVAVVLVLTWFIVPYIGYRLVGFIFLLSIITLSLFFRKGPIFFASALFAVLWEDLFIPSEKSIGMNEDSAFVLLYFVTAVIIGILIDQARERKEILTKREETARALYEIVRHIATAPSQEAMLKSVKERLGSLLNGTTEILIKKGNGGIVFDSPLFMYEDEKEKNAAIWVFENGKEAGWSTSTLPLVKNLYIPLRGFHGSVGVLAFRPNSNNPLTTEEKNLLYTVSQQLASYFERSISEEKVRKIVHTDHLEKLKDVVIKSLAKELQPPLKTITEAVQVLKEEYPPQLKEILPPTKEEEITRQIISIEHFSDKLLRMLDTVSALEKITGAEGIIVPVDKRMHTVEDIIEAATEEIMPFLEEHKLVVNIQNNLPLIYCDFLLIEILINNLLKNAIQYSPSNSTVEIEARTTDHTFILSVSDEGPGIPSDKLHAIFDKFYRLPGMKESGLGLGLSVSKRIAELHEGELTAENLPQGGSKFSLLLHVEH